MKTFKIAVVAVAIACMAAPTFAQRGGRGGGGGGGGGGGNRQGGGQASGQRGGGNPGGGQRQGGGSPSAGPRVGGGSPGGGGQRSGGGSPNIGQRPGGGSPSIGVPSVRGPSVRGDVNAGAGAGATVRQPQQPGRVDLPGVTGNVDGRVQGQINPGRGNDGNRNDFGRGGDGDRRFSNDPRSNNPRGNDPRFNNNNPQRTFANDSNFDRRNYDPRNSQVRINNRSFNYGNPNYRPSYSRYNWYNGYSAGPFGASGNNRYGVGYRGGFGNNIGTTLLGLGLSSLTGGGYGYGGGLGGLGGYGYGGGLGYPAGWGLGGWGLGSMAYNSGVLAYNNPYYSGIGGNFAYNYAQPIPVALSSEPTVNVVATQNFDTAREQFMNGDYSAALASVDAAIKLTPTDAVMHEFRALTQFALGDYRNAAATIHSVLAVGPGWDWATMIGLYPNVDVYTNQLRALEQEVTKNTRQADTRFLLGYQYMAAGHSADAGKQFAIAAEIMPQDRVAADLARLNTVEQTAAAAPAADPAAQTPAAPARPAPTIDPAKLVGDWKAERPDGSKFDVDFSPDNTFTWNFAQADKNQTLTGTYGIENDLLVLQSKDGGAMLGHISLDSDDKFTFKLLGTPDSEQGLAFNR